jgi:hypothetical protein
MCRRLPPNKVILSTLRDYTRGKIPSTTAEERLVDITAPNARHLHENHLCLFIRAYLKMHKSDCPWKLGMTSQYRGFEPEAAVYTRKLIDQDSLSNI